MWRRAKSSSSLDLGTSYGKQHSDWQTESLRRITAPAGRPPLFWFTRYDSCQRRQSFYPCRYDPRVKINQSDREESGTGKFREGRGEAEGCSHSTREPHAHPSPHGPASLLYASHWVLGKLNHTPSSLHRTGYCKASILNWLGDGFSLTLFLFGLPGITN